MIYLSYSKADIEMMQRVKQSLLDAGFEVWAGKKIKPGKKKWVRKVQKAIEESEVMVVLMSPDARASVRNFTYWAFVTS